MVFKSPDGVVRGEIFPLDDRPHCIGDIFWI